MDLVVFTAMAFNLFLIVDPVGCLPLVITITKGNTRKERQAMVLRAVIVAALVLSFFALIGRSLLHYFGVSIPAIQIGGGILLFIIGIEMLFGRVSRTEATEPEVKEAEAKPDVSITPLAIPLLAGPGAITAMILYSGSIGGTTWIGGGGWAILAVLVVMLFSWVIFSLSETILKVIGTIGVTVIARVMGLLLVFVSTQLAISGLKALGVLTAL